jgi:hypothetical protein
MILMMKIEDTKGCRHQLEGFRHFWGMYVTGFDHTQHCIKCLRGKRSAIVTPKVKVGQSFMMSEAKAFDYLYLCGVETDFTWARNFHMALRPRPGATAIVETWNGFKVTVRDAELLQIPALPDDFQGLDRSYTTCRNFQFGVAAYQRRFVKVAA